MKKLFLTFIFSAALILSFHQAEAADGKAVLDANNCGGCHKMAGPAVKTIAEVLKRKAPDLFYAGSKFQEAWLVGFLQNPTTIRPAGTVYTNNVKADAKGIDQISGVEKCASKLSAGDAEAATKHLMTLKDASMKTGVITLGKFSKPRAKKTFGKDAGCNACHQIVLRGKKIMGGVSCPTLFNAGDRLNPDWVYSFIRDPQSWDPKIWMPNRELDEKTATLLTQFIMSQKTK